MLVPLLTGSCWLVAPWRRDAHTDHDTAGAVAAEVASTHGAQLLEYPIWAWHWAAPGDDRLPWDAALALPLPAATRERKGEAMAVHRSQVEPLSPAPGDEVMLGEHVPGPLPPGRRGVLPDRRATAPPRTEDGGRGIQSLPAAFFEEFYARRRRRPVGLHRPVVRAPQAGVDPGGAAAGAVRPWPSSPVARSVCSPRSSASAATTCSRSTSYRRPSSGRATRTAHLPGVRVEQGSVPADWPEGVVRPRGALRGRLLLRTGRPAHAGRPGGRRRWPTDGVLVACHWRHPVPEYPLGGDAVHAALRAHPRLALLAPARGGGLPARRPGARAGHERGARDRPGAVSAPLPPPVQQVAVVVPARNERQLLTGCLAALAAAAERVTVPVTVLVVLDRCTDGTAEMLAGRPGVRSVESARRLCRGGAGHRRGSRHRGHRRAAEPDVARLHGRRLAGPAVLAGPPPRPRRPRGRPRPRHGRPAAGRRRR